VRAAGSRSQPLAAGIRARTLAGLRLSDGLINTDKPRPARRSDQPVLFVEWIKHYGSRLLD
jgi:hypothetical protein